MRKPRAAARAASEVVAARSAESKLPIYPFAVGPTTGRNDLKNPHC